ncbi:MAG: UPF0182 family protein [Filifactoraceae bacterium]
MWSSRVEFKKSKIIPILMVCIVVLVVSSFGSILNFITDLTWFREVGYTETYLKRVFAKLYIAIPFFIGFFIFLRIYFRQIKSGYYKHMDLVETPDEKKFVGRILTLASGLISIFYSFNISSLLWMEILKFLNSTNFNVNDPIFFKDISFYVFKLPLIEAIFGIVLNLIFVVVAVTVVFYVIMLSYKAPTIIREYNDDDVIREINPKAKIEKVKKDVITLAATRLAMLGALFFIILGLKDFLATYNLLFSPRGAIYGAGYTDINVTLWMYRIKAIISIITAILIIVSRTKKSYKPATKGIVALVAVTVLGFGADTFIQNFVVSPNELSKEREYIKYNIEYTNKAYGLDKIEIKDFAVDQSLTVDDLVKNPDTISNISLNDYRPTKEAYNQLQGLRGYYNFNDVDIDRYTINNKLTQVFLAVREIDKTRLEDKAQNWVNTRLKYTHGYGIAMSPANELTSSGQPNMIVKNVPVTTEFENLNLNKPQVYFGELTNDYVVVNTSEEEFDYPQGESNATVEYDGTAGINMNIFNKLIYSIKYADFKLLIAGGIDSNSKILINRNIMDRTKKIAPFLNYDTNPYAIIDEGRVKYIIDGYTLSSNYPYSTPFNEGSTVNYIRNSFKVVVDSYDGNIEYYIVDKEDPMVNTYSKIFPKLFKPMSEMPDSIKSHLRYPQEMFDIQTKMYGTYHMSDPNVFYNREDKWDIPKENYYQGENPTVDAPKTDNIIEMESLYFTLKLPHEQNSEFVLSIPYTPKGKQNATAQLIARNDGENYGKMILYRYPKDKTIIGPEQMEAKISNNDVISRDLSLWDTRGSKVLRGHILMIPIESSILYVEPLYIRADSENAIPEVKRIIVGYNDKIVMEETLEKALEKVFGSTEKPLITTVGGEAVDTSATESVDKPISEGELPSLREASELFVKAQEALKAGSLSEYENYINRIGEILKSYS